MKALQLDDISTVLKKFNEIHKKLHQLQLVNEKVAYETTSWRITCLLKKERSNCIVGKSCIIEQNSKYFLRADYEELLQLLLSV